MSAADRSPSGSEILGECRSPRPRGPPPPVGARRLGTPAPTSSFARARPDCADAGLRAVNRGGPREKACKRNAGDVSGKSERACGPRRLLPFGRGLQQGPGNVGEVPQLGRGTVERRSKLRRDVVDDYQARPSEEASRTTPAQLVIAACTAARLCRGARVAGGRGSGFRDGACAHLLHRNGSPIPGVRRSARSPPSSGRTRPGLGSRPASAPVGSGPSRPDRMASTQRAPNTMPSKQRVRRKPVGAVYAAAGDLTGRPEPWERRRAVEVDEDATGRVVGGRRDRQPARGPGRTRPPASDSAIVGNLRPKSSRACRVQPHVLAGLLASLTAIARLTRSRGRSSSTKRSPAPSRNTAPCPEAPRR